MSDADGLAESARPYALYPLRLGLALVFIVYGWNKFQDLSGVEAMFDGWGIPFAGVTVVLVAIAELFGGIGLLLGVLSRFSAAVLSIVMLTAIFTVKVPGPLQGGYAIDVALLAGTLTILVNGPGRPTIFTALERADLSVEAWVRERLPWTSKASERDPA